MHAAVGFGKPCLQDGGHENCRTSLLFETSTTRHQELSLRRGNSTSYLRMDTVNGDAMKQDF